MVDSRENIALGSDAASASPLSGETPGAVLASARQKMGLSVGDIAAKLRMSVVQIDAIERGEYTKLPKGTFLRGFVRSYAKLVALSPDEVLKLLEDTHAESRKPEIVVPTQNIRMSAPGERYSNPRARLLFALILLLAIVAGVAYWWFQVRPGQAEHIGRWPEKTVPAPVPVPAPTAPVVEQQVPSTATPPAADVAAQPTGTPASLTASAQLAPEAPQISSQQVAPLTQTTAPLAPAPTGATESKSAVPKGGGSLRFSFTGDAWVEVVDVNGRTLVSRRFQNGQSETVVGKLPMSVVIGNATVTKLQFNDVDFDLTPHTRVAVARFTLK